MRQYETYKDSGVEWIGRVPSHWERCRFKDFEYLRTEKSNNQMKIGLENIESKTGKYLTTDSEFEGDGVAFYPNDVVYGKLRPYLQKVWLADFEGNAVGDFFVFKNKHNCNSRYLFYLMLSDGFTSECNGATLGAKMPRVSSEFIQGLRFFLPPIKEQKAIADYLDEKTAQIDGILKAREEKIQLLEELKSSIISNAVTKGIKKNIDTKDSGVVWIDKIPNAWNMMKLNFICHFITDFVASGSFADLRTNVTYLDEPDYAMLVRTTDLSNKNKDVKRVYVSKESYAFLSNSNLHGGEIILPNIGASIGDVYMVPNNLYKNMTLGPNAIMLKTKFNDDYYFYYFKSESGRKALEMIGQAAAQGKFNKTELRQMRVPVPPLDEQQEIVNYIEKRINHIDESIFNAYREINLLKEFRASLITEVVTGKRKVLL